MKKMFGKSKRNKEKEKERERTQQENDFLYGRAKSKGGTSSQLSQSTVISNGDSASQINTSTLDAEVGGDRDSMSTSYYRGDSYEAVSSKHNHGPQSASSQEISSISLRSRGSAGEVSHRNNYGNSQNEDWETATAPAAGGGGRSKTSGLSQAEKSRLTKQKLKKERKNRGTAEERALEPRNSAFEERFTKSVIVGSSCLYGDEQYSDEDEVNDVPKLSDVQEDNNDGISNRHDKDDRRRRHTNRRKERKHAQSDIGKPRTHRGQEHDLDQSRERHATQEEDRKIKDIIKRERELTRGGHRPGNLKSNEDDQTEQKMHHHRDQEEIDKSVKERIREERFAVERKRAERDKKAKGRIKAQMDEARKSAGSNASVDDDLEQKRLRQRERAEKDKKMKERIREQTTAIKGPSASVDDDLEQKRHRQRERAEKDKKMKERIREQTAATKGPSASVDDDLEQKRHRQREQAEKDKKMKERIRDQTAATKGPPASVDNDLEQKRHRQREQAEKDRKMKERIRDQTAATKGLSHSDHSKASHNMEDDEMAQKRRRQQEQAEKDRKMKEEIREQRNAAKEIRNNTSGNKYTNSNNSYNGNGIIRNQKQTEDRVIKGRVSFGGGDSFEKALHDAGGLGFSPRNARIQKQEYKANREKEDEYEYDDESGEEVQQSRLIDMHIAQFRATAKIGANDDDLSEFEAGEFKRNAKRRASRRVSTTTMKINAWHQKHSYNKAVKLAERPPFVEWVTSFYRCDPRWQIMKFFDEVAREGGETTMDENLASSPLANLFNKASVFTVWRPTSKEAIKNMVLGLATGKGLDIKGKSAKRGNISSYVPFIQIYEEPHKEHVRALIKDGRIVRVFYQTEKARNEAHEMILDVKDFMLFAAEDAMRVLSDEYADQAEQELAMKHLMYDDTNLAVGFVDEYANSANPVFGLDITERLFWESYVMMQDCSRPERTEWDIGRNSELTFMDMNFKAIRYTPPPGDPRAVVYQMSKCSPMEPRMLLMAYEEHGCVKPVVSDFDCFLLGSRGVKYKNPIPPEQVDLVKWSVKNISEVLEERAVSGDTTEGWMERWFKVLKKAALKGYYPKTPKYGNGDPKSYEIIGVAVDRLKATGCVRHGAECFNWFFPQEIDEEFLVVSDTLPGDVKWKYVNVQELQELLITKIAEGFTFPINPKWVLCDPGWRRVYDKLLASEKPNVQDSINCWLPPDTGLRAEIDAISARHPLGFEGTGEKTEGTEVMDLMEEDLERYFKIQRAWRKLRLVLFWIRFVREKRLEREEREAEALSRFSGAGDHV